MNANRYEAPNGRVGVGFKIEHAGRPQHSVAWPDGIAERYMDDELEERQIKVSTLCIDCPQPAETMRRKSVDEIWIDEESKMSDAALSASEFLNSGKLFDGKASVNIITPPVDQQNLDTSNQTNDNANQNSENESKGLKEFNFNPKETEAANIRECLLANPDASNQDVITALHDLGMEVSSSQVSAQRRQRAKQEKTEQS